MHSMILTTLTLAILLTAVDVGRAGAREPVPLIFDTDICGDCDDVLALAMIHALQSRGECRLIAVTVSADNELAAPFVDAVNTFYGRGEVPIGVVGAGGAAFESRYLGLAEVRDGGRLRYPHNLISGRSAPSATSVLRSALASQPDGSVVVVQVGFSTNLARLLDSPPDDHSPLPGEALVRRKVKQLSLMAGAFRPIDKKAHFGEYNIVKDLPSARALAARWPTPMVWSGFEIGIALPYPAVSIERDFSYVAHHPVAEAYVRYNPPPHNRPTWDLTSVLDAVRPDRGYFDLSATGTVTVEPDGSSRFEPNPEGRHRYLILRPDQAPRVLEALVQLSSQPPNPIASGKPLSMKITAEQAVRIAEEFIQANGYTDFTPVDIRNLDLDIAEGLNVLQPKEVLSQRRNTLRPRAYGWRKDSRSDPEGWTVGFQLVKPSKDHPTTGRAVTMDEHGSHVQVQHIGFYLENLSPPP